MEFGILNPLGKWLMPKLIAWLRRWDFIAAQRPDFYIANSKNTQERISKYYNRESEVIYPSIDISEFPKTPIPLLTPQSKPLSWEERGDFYLAVGRCIPYKKFDLLVETFNQNGKKLIIATNTENKLYKKLRRISKKNIEWKMKLPRNEIIDLYAHAKAFVFPPEEDFGLVPIEAQACGTPVIAYGKGGALETVIPKETSLGWDWSQGTGIFFSEQTPESLNAAIKIFESIPFDADAIRKHAEKFDTKIFQEKIVRFIEEKMQDKKS